MFLGRPGRSVVDFDIIAPYGSHCSPVVWCATTSTRVMKHRNMCSIATSGKLLRLFLLCEKRETASLENIRLVPTSRASVENIKNQFPLMFDRLVDL